jgi:predicted Zn-dependent protease
MSFRDDDSEAALVGVIGQELSHLDRGHQLLRVKAQKLAPQTFAEGGVGPRAAFTKMSVLTRLWSRPFRPEDEREADNDGARWAYHAGYDAREMAKLFLRLHERNQAQRTNIPVPSFLRSHPYEVARHAAVTELYEQLQSDEPRDDLYVGQENLQQRTARGFEGSKD